MRAIPEHLRGEITTRHYTNPRLPLPYLTLSFSLSSVSNPVLVEAIGFELSLKLNFSVTLLLH